jgi:ABC-type multidrug transport system fused ATPase/permease subunit
LLLLGWLFGIQCVSRDPVCSMCCLMELQDSWIQNATVKQNILMRAPYDEARYNCAISACALEQDLATLPQGDDTEIGEKGVTLSGVLRCTFS